MTCRSREAVLLTGWGISTRKAARGQQIRSGVCLGLGLCTTEQSRRSPCAPSLQRAPHLPLLTVWCWAWSQSAVGDHRTHGCQAHPPSDSRMFSSTWCGGRLAGVEADPRPLWLLLEREPLRLRTSQDVGSPGSRDLPMRLTLEGPVLPFYQCAD